MLEKKIIMMDQVGARCITASKSPAVGFIITAKDQFGSYTKTYALVDWTNALEQYDRTLVKWQKEAAHNES